MRWGKRGHIAQIIGYLIAALFFGVLGLGNFAIEVDLQRRGVEVPATVTDVATGKYGHVGIEFTTRTGRTTRTEIGRADWNGKYPATGKRIKVLYDPAAPDQYVRQADRNLFDKYWLVVMFAGISLIMLYIASRHIRHRRRPRPAVPAEFTDLLDGDTTSTWPGIDRQHRAP